MRWQSILPICITLLLLVGLTGFRMSLPTAADAAPYHAIVRAVISEFPYQIGDWVGTDVEIPAGALTLLRPNAHLARSYVNTQTQQHIEFLIIQCRDSNDMLGHYPPVCYPSSGWKSHDAQAMEWNVGDPPIKGMEYEFTQVLPGRVLTKHVIDLLLLPNGRLVRNMSQVNALASGYRTKYYGAAQIQMVTNDNLTAEQRRQTFEEFMAHALDIVQAIGSGVKTQ